MKKRIILAIAIAMMAIVLATGAFATISMNYSVEDATTDTGVAVKKIVLTMTDDESDWRALQTKINFNYEKIIPIDWYDGSVPSYTGEAAEYPFKFNSFKSGRTSTAELGRPQTPVWTINGAESSLVVELYWAAPDTYPITATDTMIYEIYFKYADGVTYDNLAASDFELTYVHYTDNGAYHYYGHEDDSLNDIVVTNNVVPAPTVITIPVLAGDKVYLANGTVVEIDANGEYDVTDQAGKYVAVYTGNGYAGTNANNEEMTIYQTTYYVGDTEAKEVHTNGVFASAYNALRDRTPYDHDKNEETAPVDRNGLRFKFSHNPAGRNVDGHEITEVGFIMTAESSYVLGAAGADYVLNMDMVEDGYAKQGVAFGYDQNGNYRNMALETENDDAWLIGATFYNIKITEANVKTNIVSRPYYKVGDTYIYGEITKKSLRDAAWAIKEAAGENYDTEYPEGTKMREYIDEILYASGDLQIVDEVIIDVSGLYAAAAALE